MATFVPAIPTVGEIARQLGESVHRVEYVIRSRNIQPIGRAGNARVFDEAAVQSIADVLAQIAHYRCGDQGE